MQWTSLLVNVDVWICVIMVVMAIYIWVCGQKVKGPVTVRFPKIPKVVKTGRYGKYEERCREIFQRTFRRRFVKIRPDFLKNPMTGKNLELDGFCPNVRTKLGMGLAFEYDGAQHAKKTPIFHKNDQQFVNQVKRDFFKDRVCRQKGIALIRIPHTVKYNKLEEYIMEKLRAVM
jgi:hypothetical protein